MTRCAHRARHWRQMLMTEAFRRHHVLSGEGLDDALLRTAQSQYDEGKRYLGGSKTDAGETEANCMAVYVSAVALLTFGDLEVVQDIFMYNPGPPCPVAVFDSVIADLVPLPDTLNIHEDRGAVIRWIQDHRGRLRWSESAGRYLLDPS